MSVVIMEYYNVPPVSVMVDRKYLCLSVCLCVSVCACVCMYHNHYIHKLHSHYSYGGNCSCDGIEPLLNTTVCRLVCPSVCLSVSK